jgi:hypothetical protein
MENTRAEAVVRQKGEIILTLLEKMQEQLDYNRKFYLFSLKH